MQFSRKGLKCEKFLKNIYANFRIFKFIWDLTFFQKSCLNTAFFTFNRSSLKTEVRIGLPHPTYVSRTWPLRGLSFVPHPQCNPPPPQSDMWQGGHPPRSRGWVHRIHPCRHLSGNLHYFYRQKVVYYTEALWEKSKFLWLAAMCISEVVVGRRAQELCKSWKVFVVRRNW